jgi:hypothetical protein
MLHEVPYKIMNSELVNSEWVHSINTYWTFIKMSDQMCRVRTQNVSHIWFKGQFRNFLAWGCCAAWKKINIYALEWIGLSCSPPFGLIGAEILLELHHDIYCFCKMDNVHPNIRLHLIVSQPHQEGSLKWLWSMFLPPFHPYFKRE